MTCAQIVGAPTGGLLHGDERECGREVTLDVYRAGQKLASVCKRHGVRFRRMKGYEVKERANV